MRLSPGERSILAYFPSSNAARRAVEELKAAGYEIVGLDRVSRFGVEDDAEVNYAVAGRAETITGLTLFSAGIDSLANSDSRVLKAADPSVSGYGAHDYGVAGGRAFLVTVVTGGDRVQPAVAILEKHGGQV
ncbi:hypothetical protein GFC01_02280 [Desulfofundulus thermobenzoicus]|uniref:Uncharacterized protein n=1 Tax=Desulfofundulus thermobenzoicus TaxID=29376 RepID=A0A6N7IMD3_9FIRM|nr:hypothetical protein [Desulfofundulus thermobenzoicus]MQL51111.1 hypothetical protein [Desulfofundulus thermobenzoicus]